MEVTGVVVEFRVLEVQGYISSRLEVISLASVEFRALPSLAKTIDEC